MKLIIFTLILAVAVGYAFGGRLGNVSRLRIRWAPLAVVGFAMQVYDPPGNWPLALLFGSFVLLSIFVLRNRRIAGFMVILVGVALNFIVIAANRGMPVSAQALQTSRQMGTMSGLTNNADAYVKHHLASGDDKLLFLGDVIGLAPPVSQAISIGDIVTYGGVCMVVIVAMRRKEEEREQGEYEMVPSSAGEAHGVGG